MDRRTFLAGTGAVLLAAPLGAEAQRAGQVHRIAIVAASAPVEELTEVRDPFLRELLPELRRLGYTEGQNLVLERCSAGGRPVRGPITVT